VKSGIQGSVECIHLSSVIHVSSSGIFAPFLVPFTELPVSLWGVMYILDHFILHFWGNELLFEGIFKGVLHSVIKRVCCKCSGDAIAGPISGLGSLFKVG